MMSRTDNVPRITGRLNCMVAIMWTMVYICQGSILASCCLHPPQVWWLSVIPVIYYSCWSWLEKHGNDIEKDVKFSSYDQEKINLPCVAFSTLISCVMIVWVAATVGLGGGDKCDLKTVTSFAKFMLLKKLLNHSLMHTALAGVRTFWMCNWHCSVLR